MLAVDLYGGDIAATPGEAQVLMQKVVENPEPARENIRRAFDFLQTVGGAGHWLHAENPARFLEHARALLGCGAGNET